MKVRELIKELRTHDPDAEVHIAYNYGDHCRTQVAPIAENVDEFYVAHSDYHNMPKLVDDDDDQIGDDQSPVVVIQA